MKKVKHKSPSVTQKIKASWQENSMLWKFFTWLKGGKKFK